MPDLSQKGGLDDCKSPLTLAMKVQTKLLLQQFLDGKESAAEKADSSKDGGSTNGNNDEPKAIGHQIVEI
jgi:hypothetical protein